MASCEFSPGARPDSRVFVGIDRQCTVRSFRAHLEWADAAVLRSGASRRSLGIGIDAQERVQAGAGALTVANEPDKERLLEIYETEAPHYDRVMGVSERILLGSDTRKWVCRRAEGTVLEVAIGTGLNLHHYRPGLRLTAIELSAPMLDIAKQRAAKIGLEADLRLGDAEQLDFDNASFDTVVCTFSLCTIPDDRRAFGEMCRVLRPGGKLILAEHVRSPVAVVRGVQHLLEPLTLRFGGDHLLREPLEHVHAEGLVVDEFERVRLGITERLAAHKPVT